MTYVEALLDALAQSGRSGRDVSIEAVGHESAIRSLKRGLDLRVSTIQALCGALDLEFYIGPPRGASERAAQSEADLRPELQEQAERAAASAGVVQEAGLSHSDRRLLRCIEEVLITLDDPDLRASLASLARFAHKRSVSGQGAGGDAEAAQ